MESGLWENGHRLSSAGRSWVDFQPHGFPPCRVSTWTFGSGRNISTLIFEKGFLRWQYGRRQGGRVDGLQRQEPRQTPPAQLTWELRQAFLSHTCETLIFAVSLAIPRGGRWLPVPGSSLSWTAPACRPQPGSDISLSLFFRPIYCQHLLLRVTR